MKRVVFFGTPELAVPFLDALHAASDFEIVGVITQPDKPVGRKQELTPSPVKLRVDDLGLNLLQPKTLKHEIPTSKIKALEADLFVVVAYGKIIPKNILDLAPAINVHPSLLPKYRGPSPMPAAILNGDPITGISIMLLDEGMDSGPVLAQEEIVLEARETAKTLEQKVMELGPQLLLNTMQRYINEEVEPQPQDESQVSICSMLTRDNGEITWNESLKEIDQKIRALTPWPGTYFNWVGSDARKGVIRVKIIKSRLDESGLNLLEVQPAGKKPMSIDQFLNGYSI